MIKKSDSFHCILFLAFLGTATLLSFNFITSHETMDNKAMNPYHKIITTALIMLVTSLGSLVLLVLFKGKQLRVHF
jgi:hypothetical protein